MQFKTEQAYQLTDTFIKHCPYMIMQIGCYIFASTWPSCEITFMRVAR
jgi:hypothetical protein